MKKAIITEGMYRRVLLKESKEHVIYIQYDQEYGFNSEESEDDYEESEESEESGIDDDAAYNAAHAIANETGVNILSDKNLKGILYDTNEKKVVGGLWTSETSDGFSFDIAITPSYQNYGLSSELIRNAIEEYKIQKDAYEEMDEPFPMEVDVINPKLVEILKNKYGFKIIRSINGDRKIMTINEDRYSRVFLKESYNIDGVWYHGTNAKFDKFNLDFFGKTDDGWYGRGIYFHSDKDTAEVYGRNVIKARLNYKKSPLILPIEKFS